MRLPTPALRSDRFEQPDVAYAAMTRFNLRGLSPAVAALPPADYAAWCARRADAFRAFCLPAMLAQRPRPHAWFLLFDADVVPPVADLLADLAPHDWVVPLFLPAAWGPALRDDVPRAVREHLAPTGAAVLCCARLDSDDSLDPRFFAALDAAIGGVRLGGEPAPSWAVDLPYGAVQEDGAVFACVADRWFFALVEPLATCTTPYRRRHTELDVPLVAAYTERPLWLHQRHGANIGGFATGRLERFADPAALLARFGISASPSTAPSGIATGG